jgi:DMSO/TMAO reductase YedYZ molybdopterin-dependent catalytic subunit
LLKNGKFEGAITENMDQSTFESGAAIGCHGVKWIDDQNRVWEGIPLWYLVGRVDDPTETHKGDAFSDFLADAGYIVQLIAADGYTFELTSAEVKRNDALIIAYKRDGNPLPENQWPLRLVGGTLQKSQMIGQITTIKLVFSTEETTTPSGTEDTLVLTVTKEARLRPIL